MDYIISIDWLAVSAIMSDVPAVQRRPRIIAGFTLSEQPPTAVWGRRVFLLSPEGEKVATYLFQPKSQLLDSRRLLIEVANRFLYFQNSPAMVSELVQIYACRVTGISRVDLCADFECRQQQLDVINSLNDGSARVSSISIDVPWRDKGVPYCFTFGHKESYIKWKLYNKYKELHISEVCSKPYIEDLWQQCGFDVQSVWRLEVSLKKLCRLNIKGFTGENWLTIFDMRQQLFMSLYMHRFVIRKCQGHTNRSRDERVFLISPTDVPKLVTTRESCQRVLSEPTMRMLRFFALQWKYGDVCGPALDLLKHNVVELCRDGLCRFTFLQLTGLSIKEFALAFPKILDVPPAERDHAFNQMQLDFGDPPMSVQYRPLTAEEAMPELARIIREWRGTQSSQLELPM